MKVDPVALRTFLDAMHAHADIRDQRTKSIAGIVTDARGKGVDGKALRKVFVRERMDAEKRQRDDELLSAYEGALGGKGRALAAIAEGASVVDAARANGVHRATVARARDVAKQASNAAIPHDPETGEVTEAATLGVEPDARSEQSTPAEQSVNLAPSSGPVEAGSYDGEGEQSGTHSVEQGGRQSPLRDGEASADITTASALPSPPIDDLAFPAHLRRERVSA